MSASIEFLLGLLEQQEPACVAHEDFEGPHEGALRAWQEVGFLSRESAMHGVPSCPHCDQGVPYRLDGRYVCNGCRSAVDARHLRSWRLNVGVFLGWMASGLHLRGHLRQLEEGLWHLGTWGGGDELHECFYRKSGPLSDLGMSRLAAYRNVLVLHGLARPPESERLGCRYVSLLDVLRVDRTLGVMDLQTLLLPRGEVRFESHSGALWVGDAWLGEVAPGCKEYHFLRCLAQDLDHFVPYADLKREVLRNSGSTDTTEEATFCQRLKSRIKNKWIPKIDLLIATTNKADGYRLRGHLEL